MGAWVLGWITRGCLGAATVIGVVGAQCKLAGRKGWSREVMVLEQRDDPCCSSPTVWGRSKRRGGILSQRETEAGVDQAPNLIPALQPGAKWEEEGEQ